MKFSTLDEREIIQKEVVEAERNVAEAELNVAEAKHNVVEAKYNVMEAKLAEAVQEARREEGTITGIIT